MGVALTSTRTNVYCSACRMSLRHETTFNRVLASRGISGAALARAIGTGEGNVSRVRNGMRPGENLAKRISEALNLTDEEIEALGWDTERAA